MDSDESSYCTVELLGFVGLDPLIRYLDERTCVAHLRVASHSRRLDRPGGEETDWHTVLAYGDVAHYAEGRIRKGDRVRISGRLSYRTFRSGGEEAPQVHQAVILAEEMTLVSRANEKRGKTPYREQPIDSFGVVYRDALSKDAEQELPF